MRGEDREKLQLSSCHLKLQTKKRLPSRKRRIEKHMIWQQKTHKAGREYLAMFLFVVCNFKFSSFVIDLFRDFVFNYSSLLPSSRLRQRKWWVVAIAINITALPLSSDLNVNNLRFSFSPRATSKRALENRIKIHRKGKGLTAAK